jgi:hypothetical protein
LFTCLRLLCRFGGYKYPRICLVRDPILAFSMHVISMQYNPLDCTCWAFSPSEYWEYCDLMCDTALEDFECNLGNWFFLGPEGECHFTLCVIFVLTLF